MKSISTGSRRENGEKEKEKEGGARKPDSECEKATEEKGRASVGENVLKNTQTEHRG